MAALFRHALRLGVLAFIVYCAMGGVWRNYKVAHNNDRLVGLMHGERWRQLYDLNERMLEHWDESFRASLDFLGMPWAATIFGVPTADPLLVASHAVTTRSFEPALLLGLAIPFGLAVVLGKVFCSHVCPMRLLFELGQLIRAALLRLGAPLPHLRHDARFGGWVLLGGLLGSLGAGTAVWLFLLPYVGVSAAVFLAVTAATTAGLLIAPGLLLASDVLLAPGFFCHNLCPQGFLLEQVGRVAFWRVVQKKGVDCPSTCRACEQVCPYSLSPRRETHRPACDNCGSCVSVCPKRKLSRKLALPVLASVLLCSLPTTALAHHNKGLPHYGYFENYPQVPTEESVTIQGGWEMGGTVFNFQGYDRKTADTPNDVKFFLYLYDLEADSHYQGAVDFEIRLDGETVARFSREHVDEEKIYSTRETLPESGEYEVVAHVRGADDGVSPRLYFDIDLGDEGVDWFLLGGIGTPVLLLFGLALFGRTRKSRARRMKAQTAATSAAAGLLAARPALADPAAGAHAHHEHAGHASGHAAHQGHAGHGMHGTMEHYVTEDGGQVMVMGGIPPWLLVAGVVLLIVVSFVVIERFGLSRPSSFRLNLVRNPKVYSVFRSRWFQAVPQLVAVVMLGYLVYAGLFGSQIRNVTPVAVWTIWWAGLIFAVALLGPAFCFACPWDGLSNLVTRLRVAARVDSLTLGHAVPSWLRNTWPAIGLFVLLTWAELGLGITTSPRGTAYMGIGMAALAVGAALVFQKKAFCEHLCPVGRITGLYSNFSPLEVRRRNATVCERCTTEDCLHGNEHGYACPTGLSLKVLNSATYCTGCTECFKSCNKRNVALNLRPPGADLHATRAPRVDEAWFCLALLALTLFHGFSMTTAWESFEPGSLSLLKWMKVSFGTPSWLAFTIGMVGVVAVPIALYALACELAARWAKGVDAKTLFLQYSFSILPVALFYHLAHNAMHLFMEGGNIVPLLSDPMGAGTDYFGTRDVHAYSLLTEEMLWYLQVALIVIGHLFGIVVAHRISRRLYSDSSNATRSLVPMLGVMVMLSAAGLTLMALDMNMRVGRM